MGRQDFCVTGNFTERGIQGAHGFLAEYVVEEERWAQPVPHDLAAVAVLTEPLSIAEKALIEVANLRLRLPWASGSVPAVKAPEPCAVVLGAGPAGLLGALALRARGLRTVVYARGPAREGKAAWVPSIGAEYFSSRDLSFADLLARIGRVDLVYEATGAAPAAFEALSSLGANAVFVFTGVPGRRAPLQIQGDAIMRNLVLRNQVVFGTVSAGPDAFAEAVRDLSRFMRMWPKAVRALITRYPMEEALRLVSGEAAGIKKVVAVSGLGS